MEIPLAVINLPLRYENTPGHKPVQNGSHNEVHKNVVLHRRISFSIDLSSTILRFWRLQNRTGKSLDEIEPLARVYEPTAKWRRYTG